MITDVVTASVRRLNEVEPTSVDDVRHADRLVIGMSEEMGEGDRALREFLFANMYRHDKVNQMSDRGRQVIAEIFQLYLHEPQRMPEEWRETVLGSDPATIPRLACDFIAGMTDRYALSEHERLFG